MSNDGRSLAVSRVCSASLQFGHLRGTRAFKVAAFLRWTTLGRLPARRRLSTPRARLHRLNVPLALPAATVRLSFSPTRGIPTAPTFDCRPGSHALWACPALADPATTLAGAASAAAVAVAAAASTSWELGGCGRRRVRGRPPPPLGRCVWPVPLGVGALAAPRRSPTWRFQVFPRPTPSLPVRGGGGDGRDTRRSLFQAPPRWLRRRARLAGGGGSEPYSALRQSRPRWWWGRMVGGCSLDAVPRGVQTASRGAAVLC